MWLFNWWQKRKFHTVAYRRWSIEWIDEYGMKIPGDATVGFWILQENGYGKRRFCTTNNLAEYPASQGTLSASFGLKQVFIQQVRSWWEDDDGSGI